MYELEPIFVSNDFYQSSEERSTIFSRDGSGLVCVIKTHNQFEIPGSASVIKKRVFCHLAIKGHLITPPSVKVIEEETFHDCYYLNIVDFKKG